MLTEIRDRSSGAFAYFIAALIIIPMAFWGVNEYANTSVVPTLVEIGDTKITKQELDQRLSALQDQERQRNPEFANSEFFTSDFYKRSVLGSLIDRALVEQMATDNHYRIGNAQLAELIRQEPIFQNEAGNFDPALYEEFVQSRLYSKQRFEQQIREDSRISQVADGYSQSAIVLSDDVRQLLELQAQRRTFDLVTVSEAAFRETIEVSDADVAAYYEANIDAYMDPDLISIEYVELDVNRIAENLVVDEAELRQEYENNKENFISPESRATRHILLSTSGEKSDSEQLATAQDLAAQLRDGADFAALAQQYSEDTGSAEEGGSLGDIERGQMVDEFEQAAFALEVGQISDPIETQFGYHIIEVTGVSGGVAQEFADVRFEIESQVREAQAQTEFAALLLEMRNLVFESEDSLQPVAEALGVDVLTTDFFSRDEGEGIAANGLVRQAAFDQIVVEDGLNSDPVELDEGLYVAVRKLDFKPAAPQALSDVSEQIRASLINQGAADAAKAAVESLQAKAQNSWEEVVADPELKSYQYTVSLLDEASEVSRDVIQKVSTMSLDGTEPSLDTLRVGNGDFHLIRLTSVREGDLQQVSDQVKDATRAILAQRNGASVFSSHLNYLNQAASAEVDDAAL